MSRLRIVAMSLPILYAAMLQAQTAAPAAGSYTGCAQRSSEDRQVWVLSSENMCAQMTGAFSGRGLAAHEVTVKGTLSERTSDTPATVRVESLTLTGKKCSETCTLQPPGTRGIGKKPRGEKPGREGGTPGETPQPPPKPN